MLNKGEKMAVDAVVPPAQDHCPVCGADWDGGPIPEEIREHYSPPYRWSRKIGIYDVVNDRTVAFQCPDCGHTFGRT